MKDLFIAEIDLIKVRHLESIKIELSKEERKHIIFTGKNGSGKTSTLEAMKSYLNIFCGNYINYANVKRALKNTENALIELNEDKDSHRQDIIMYDENIKNYHDLINQFEKGLFIYFNDELEIVESYKEGTFILSYYKANRLFQAEVPKNVEKIRLQNTYNFESSPSNIILKYLLDLKTTEAFAKIDNQLEKYQKITEWFYNFESLLKEVFGDNKLKLDFNIDTFEFTLKQPGHENFDFNTLSDGYAAVLNIIIDIMLRMESKKKQFYDIQGIVLIDEIETHLHIELQKKILPMLTKFFPRIQFIITTHSPFILNSINNVVIYDLENKKRVEDLSAYSYEGLVEYYFNSDQYSLKIKRFFEKYKNLINKKERSDIESEMLIEAITYLKQVPTLAAPELIYEFKIMEEKRRDNNDKN